MSQVRKSYLAVEPLEQRIALAGDPFLEPPVIQSVNGVLTATLTEAEGPGLVGDVMIDNIWSYNGVYAGPTLWAQPGDVMHIKLVNQLHGVPTNLHTHGLHVSPLGNSDNVLLSIEPGQDFDYEIVIPSDHPQGLYWYHPHRHGFVNEQISMGLSGMLVIGRPDGGFPQLNGLTQTLIGIKNALLDGNQILVSDDTTDNSLQTFLVNGQLNPTLTMQPNEWQVFNMVNLGNDSFYKLQLVSFIARAASYAAANPVVAISDTSGLLVGMTVTSDQAGIPANTTIAAINPGVSITLSAAPTASSAGPANLEFINPSERIEWLAVAEDGNPFTTVGNPQQDASFLIGMTPGRRWSALVHAPANPVAGQHFRLITQGFGGAGQTPGNFDPTNVWPAATLMTVDFAGASWTPPSGFLTPSRGLPLTPPTNYYRDLRVVPASEIAAFRTVEFNSAGGLDLINGEPFPNNGVFMPRLNTVEEWTVTNPSEQDHPFHLHTNPQQVQKAPSTIPGAPGNNGLPLFQDVIMVPAGRTIVIRIEFLDFLGTIVYHCHRVDHEDHGMMALVNILPEQPYYAVGANAGSQPLVQVFDPVTGNLVGQFLAFDPGFLGGVNVAVADVNDDAVYDIIVGAGPGADPHVIVVDGKKLGQVQSNFVISPSALLASFLAYDAGFRGGVHVAGGDITGDGTGDVITGAGAGAQPHVQVFDLSAGITTFASFYAFNPSFTGGVTVAAGEIDGVGLIDLVVGAGPGAGPHVKVIDGTKVRDVAANGEILSSSLLASFFAFAHAFRGGVFVGSGNIKGFAFDDVIVGAGQGGGSNVAVFSNIFPRSHMSHLHMFSLQQTDSFFAYDPAFAGGVKVGSAFDPVPVAPYNSNKNDVLVTRSSGADFSAALFPRVIDPPGHSMDMGGHAGHH